MRAEIAGRRSVRSPTGGLRISKARLEVVPWTRLCREREERRSASGCGKNRDTSRDGNYPLAELALSLKPVIQLVARSRAPGKKNLVGSLTNLPVSHFASRTFSCGLLRNCFLHLRRCFSGHRPPPGPKDKFLITQGILSHQDHSSITENLCVAFPYLATSQK